ncbi:MAG: shikimate dehydrogenase [Bacteroidetes bacterium]|nr:shikimate dehydrogenase [Bacteroidota bacterium]
MVKLFGLLGKSLKHSFSPDFFKAYFKEHQVDAQYQLFEIETIQYVENIFSLNPSGVNVTVPYKEEIIPFLDELDDSAKVIGAVNVVAFKNGKRIGYNTDAFGFHQSIKPFLTFHHERALIFGTGGASKAVAHVFKSIGLDVIFVSRNPNEGLFHYSDVNEAMISACKVIVNCTPVGMYPNIDEVLSIPFEALTEDHLVIDLIYNPPLTKFLSKAQEYGATILNGSSMLREQALKSWEIWNN